MQASPLINGFKTLQNDATSIIFDIPFGIPDPSIECPEGEDDRPRVCREAAENSLCVFVAAQRLRRHCGPFILCFIEKNGEI